MVLSQPTVGWLEWPGASAAHWLPSSTLAQAPELQEADPLWFCDLRQVLAW